jgi:hypothetical protein
MLQFSKRVIMIWFATYKQCYMLALRIPCSFNVH